MCIPKYIKCLSLCNFFQVNYFTILHTNIFFNMFQLSTKITIKFHLVALKSAVACNVLFLALRNVVY